MNNIFEIRFEEGPRIKDSKYVDMDDISAQYGLFPELNAKKLPHMLPPKELFAALMDEYNIKTSDHIVIYGRAGVHFTPRTLFLFKTMGHNTDKIHLLQGSLEEWITAGGQIDTTKAVVPVASILDLESNIRTYAATDQKNVINMTELLQFVQKGQVGTGKDVIILDARGSSFATGHIPGAIHIPYSRLTVSGNSLKFKNKHELMGLFEQAGVDVFTKRKIVCSCGSGVSVCNLFVALEECGREIDENNTVIYDGSWAEWSADESTPKSID